jgi:hypothetical protein
MTRLAMDEAKALSGRDLVARGERVGTIAGPVGVEHGGDADWLAVDVDGSTRAVVPVADLALREDEVTVPYSRKQVLDAPSPAGELDTPDDHALRAWYGLPSVDGSTSEGRPEFGHPGIQ